MTRTFLRKFTHGGYQFSLRTDPQRGDFFNYWVVISGHAANTLRAWGNPTDETTAACKARHAAITVLTIKDLENT